MIAKRFVLVFLIWIGLVAIFLAVAAYALEFPRYHRLASGGVQTKGLVVAKEPDKHSFIRYSYQVDHQQYTGLGNAGGINRPFEAFNPGKSVNVYYDPTNPCSSLLRDPKGQDASIVRGVAIMTLISPIFSLL